MGVVQEKVVGSGGSERASNPINETRFKSAIASWMGNGRAGSWVITAAKAVSWKLNDTFNFP